MEFTVIYLTLSREVSHNKNNFIWKFSHYPCIFDMAVQFFFNNSKLNADFIIWNSSPLLKQIPIKSSETTCEDLTC